MNDCFEPCLLMVLTLVTITTIDLRKFDIADLASLASPSWPQRWRKHACVTLSFGNRLPHRGFCIWETKGDCEDSQGVQRGPTGWCICLRACLPDISRATYLP